MLGFSKSSLNVVADLHGCLGRVKKCFGVFVIFVMFEYIKESKGLEMHLDRAKSENFNSF